MNWINVSASIKKILLVGFVFFNTFMVIRANRFAAPIARSAAWQAVYGKVNAARLPLLSNHLDWYLSWYSYLTGIDLMGVMFSTLHMRQWILLTTATYKDGRERVLPLPRQSPRTLMQNIFYDNKETKFHNNLYANEVGRQMYAYYLCKQFLVDEGSPVQSIIFKIHWRDFLTREEALRRGHHVEEPYYDYFLNEFACPDAKRLRGHDDS